MKILPQTENQHRSLSTEARVKADDLIELSVSSDKPVFMGNGYEILDHTPEAVDLSRLMNGAAVLLEHDKTKQIGVVEKAWLDNGKLRALIRFSKSPEAQIIKQDVIDAIRRNVSIGYNIKKNAYKQEKETIDGLPVYRATRWMPYELSIVSVPADPTIGVGRSFKTGKRAGPDQPVLVYDDAGNLVQAFLPDGSMVDDPTELQALAASLGAVSDDAPTPSESDAPVSEDSTAEEAQAVSDGTTEPVAPEAEVVEPTEPIKEMVEAVQEKVENLSESLETLSNALLIDEAEDALETETSDDASSPVEEETTKQDDEASSRHIMNITFQESSPMKNNLDSVSNPLQLTDKEQKQYSITRAINAQIDGKRSGFEFEVSDQIAKDTKRDAAGFFMPTSVRSFAIGDAATAGAITFTQGGQFIDYLRNKAVVAKLGADAITLNQKTALPRLRSDLAATWISEDGSGASYASASMDQVVFSPKKLATYTGYSRETLAVASFDIESIVRNNIYNAFTVAFDRAAIQGAGGNAPLGLLNATGLASGTITGALTHFAAVELFGKVAGANADQGNLAYLTTPTLMAKGMVTAQTGSISQPLITAENKIGVYPVGFSNNVSSGFLIFGDWSSMTLAEFGAIDIVVDPYTSKHKGLVEIGATMLGDVQFKTLESFAVNKSLT